MYMKRRRDSASPRGLHPRKLVDKKEVAHRALHMPCARLSPTMVTLASHQSRLLELCDAQVEIHNCCKVAVQPPSCGRGAVHVSVVAAYAVKFVLGGCACMHLKF